MSVTDKQVHAFAAFARRSFQFPVATVGISQNAVFAGLIPYPVYAPAGLLPYALVGWQIDNVQVFCTAVTATTTIAVIQGGTSLVGNVTPVAGTVVNPAFVGTLAVGQRRGIFGSQLFLQVITNGSGTVTNLLVTVTLRPFPLDNEAA